MEAALQKLMKESGSTKHAPIATAASKALDLLESYSRAPSTHYRETTLEAVRHALQLGNSKHISGAVVVLQKLTRDDRFHTKVGSREAQDEQESDWMSVQVLAAIHGTESLHEDQKQEILKILLSLSCQPGWFLNGRIVLQLFTLCLTLYAQSGNRTKAAAVATCAQTAAEYSRSLSKKVVLDSEDELSGQYNDSLPVFQFIVCRLDSIIRSPDTACLEELPLLLQILFELLKCIPVDIVDNSHFKKLVCTKLSPTIVAYLNVVDQKYNSSTSEKTKSGFSWKKRRPVEVKLSDAHAKVLVASALELSRILAPDPEMRPVLESLYHRIFVSSETKARIGPIHLLADAFSDGKRILDLSFFKATKPNSHSASNGAESQYEDDIDEKYDPMAVFKILATGIEQCGHDSEPPELGLASLKCVRQLLYSLQALSNGENLDEERAKLLVTRFKTLSDADYQGPSAYDPHSKLPKEYQDAITSSAISSEAEKDVSIDQEKENDNEEKTEDDIQDTTENSCTRDDNSKEASDSEAEHDSKEASAADLEQESSPEGKESEARGESPSQDQGNARSDEVEKSDPDSYDDDVSEATEGPEEGFEGEQGSIDLEVYINETADLEKEAAIFHNSKIPRTLTNRNELMRRRKQCRRRLFSELEMCDGGDSSAKTRGSSARTENDIDELEDEDDDDEDECEETNEMERENARIFVERLKSFIDSLISARGSIEMDFRLQQFASAFCQDFSMHSTTSRDGVVIINADGIYLASYFALRLNLQFVLGGHYTNSNHSGNLPTSSFLSTTREEFIEDILGSGLLVYLSPVWLAEVYEAIDEMDALGLAVRLGANAEIGGSGGKMTGLKNLLIDLDGLGQTDKGAQLLRECRRFQPDMQSGQRKTDDELFLESAGKRLSRRILTTCWSSLLSLLISTLNSYLQGGDVRRTKTLAAFLRRGGTGSGSGSGEDDRLSTGLECLQTAMILCNRLELHNRCGEMLEPLTTIICPDGLESLSKKKTASAATMKKCALSDLVSIDDVLQNGLELGSQSQDCWKYVMRCVTYVLSLRSHEGSRVKPVIPASNSIKPKASSKRKDDDVEDLDLNFGNGEEDEEEYTPSAFALPAGFSLEDEGQSIAEYFQHYLTASNGNNSGASRSSSSRRLTALNAEEWGVVLAILNRRIDRLFDDASAKLNLRSLMGFMSELCFCSHKELLTIFPKGPGPLMKKKAANIKTRRNISVIDANDALLFHRIAEAMLKCVRSGRPLLHMVKAWAIVGPHLMEAACHREMVIAKKAVEHIHSIVAAFLQNTTEQPYFHFNESLFKPFENLVCLELCDADIQDQIVSSICEFVESNTSDIGSGWRSLFGTLKSVHFPLEEGFLMGAPAATTAENGSTSTSSDPKWRAVRDVFEAFLATENPQVFANAALDFVSCLIHHVRGSEERQQLEEYISIEDMDRYLLQSGRSRNEDLTSAALSYLLQCNDILRRMHSMTACPVFQGAHRVHMLTRPSTVDPVIPDGEFWSFDAATDTIPDFPYSYKSLQTTGDISAEEVDLLTKDRSRSSLLRVWYLLFDGLTSAVINCPRGYQSQAVDSLFEMFHSLFRQHDDDDPDQSPDELATFGLYCTNHLLLPMLQAWLRRSQRTFQGWASSGPNFKHCMGRTTELVMHWLQLPNQPDRLRRGLTLALKQLLLILIECTVVPVESVARLGCSCFRHVITSGRALFDQKQWDIICLSLCRAAQLTLYPLNQLMAPFYQGSSNFYGDVGDVKVAARKDSCKQETHRLQQLAQQVLLLDEQRSELPSFPENPDLEERSFLFLLRPPGMDGNTDINHHLLRVPLRALLTGLTAHHILLQIIGTILLQGTKHVVPGLANLLLHGSIVPPLTPSADSATKTFLGGDRRDVKSPSNASSSSETENVLPGMLNHLVPDHVHMLLCCLKASYTVAIEFDSRPGLKFLVQKVAQLSNAANLYKQAGAAWSLMALTLFDLSLAQLRARKEDVNPDQVKQLLEKHQKSRNTQQFTALQDAAHRTDADQRAATLANLTSSDTFFVDLHNLFLDVCELYVDIIIDKDGAHSKLDEMSKQQLYFLTIEPDDFNDILGKKKDSCTSVGGGGGGRKSQVGSVASIEEVAEESASHGSRRSSYKSEMKPPQPAPAATTSNKPFQFSDFASQPIGRSESPNVSEDSDLRQSEHLAPDDDVDDDDDDAFRASASVAGGAAGNDEEVFRVTTQEEMNSMMSEYRFRKRKRTLPSSNSSKDSPGILNTRKNPFLAKPPANASSPGAAAAADPEIAEQQRSSIMADSEAQVTVWNELVLVLLQLSRDLSGEEFKVFLPLLYPGVKTLTTHGRDPELKLEIAEFFQRVASIYGFNPNPEDK